MGIDITGVFQKKEGEHWVDVSSNYNNTRDYALYAWLEIGYGDRCYVGSFRFEKPLSDFRGFPPDFNIVEDDCVENCHPIASDDIRPPADRNDPSRQSPTSIFYLKISMGQWGFSWLHADEILNATPIALRRIATPIEVYRQWDGVSDLTDWEPYWGDYDGDDDSATPDNITEITKKVLLDWDYDFTEDFRYFVDEVRRLKALHGEVRFVFGFC